MYKRDGSLVTLRGINKYTYAHKLSTYAYFLTLKVHQIYTLLKNIYFHFSVIMFFFPQSRHFSFKN